MKFFLQKKIEEIRRKPEEVRMRYVMLCVFCSMVFIVGIWLLAMQDHVFMVASEAPRAVEGGKELKGEIPSLNDLFERAVPLRIDEEETDGRDFFDQQLQEKQAPGVGE